MNHIKSYEEALNEGILDKVKEWLFPKTFRINYSVQHARSTKDAAKKEDKKYKIVSRIFDVKAKTETEAESKFWKLIERETKGLDPKPTVDIISIYETKKMERKNVKV